MEKEVREISQGGLYASGTLRVPFFQASCKCIKFHRSASLSNQWQSNGKAMACVATPALRAQSSVLDVSHHDAPLPLPSTYTSTHVCKFLSVGVCISWAKHIPLSSVAIDLRIDYPVPDLAQAETVDSEISNQTFDSVSRRQFKK